MVLTRLARSLHKGLQVLATLFISVVLPVAVLPCSQPCSLQSVCCESSARLPGSGVLSVTCFIILLTGTLREQKALILMKYIIFLLQTVVSGVQFYVSH